MKKLGVFVAMFQPRDFRLLMPIDLLLGKKVIQSLAYLQKFGFICVRMIISNANDSIHVKYQ